MILMATVMAMFVSGDVFMEGSIDQILNQAKKSDKMVLVDVYTTWCGPCKLLDRTTWADEKVKAFLKDQVISLKIDAEKGEGPEFAKKYKVRGYPSILLLNSDGELVDRTIGFIPPAQFLKWAKNAVN